MKKRNIALLLAFSMLLSVAGCGSKQEETAAEVEKTETVTETTVSSETTEADPAFAPFDEMVTITTAGSEYVGAVYPEGDDVTNNIWIRDFKEKLNIDLVFDWVNDEYETKLNLSIANKDLPDVFRVTEAQLKDLIEADLVWDLSEVFEQYASESVKELKKDNEDIFATGMKDGALYGIPELHYGYISQPNQVWIRNDWKEELNLPDPENMEDLVAICEAFMENYGAWGIADENTMRNLFILAPAWQAYPQVWVTAEDGSIVYGSVQKEMKDALTVYADWYKKGFLNDDFALADLSAVIEKVVNGEVGVLPWYNWFGWTMGNDLLQRQGLESMFLPYEIPSATDKEYLAPVNFQNMGYTVVSKDCEHPEAALKIINYYIYMQYDAYRQGDIDFDTMSNYVGGSIEHVLPFRMVSTNQDYDKHVAVTQAIETGDTSNLSGLDMNGYNDCMLWLENQDIAGSGSYLQNEVYRFCKEIIDEERILKNRLWGASPDALVDYGSTLDSILLEGFVKIIMGKEPIDYFDTLVEEWEAAGGDIVTQAMNEAYGN